MGTRSLIIMRVKNPDGSYTVWSVIYQQYDGYIEGVGAQLCELLHGLHLVNGISSRETRRIANGAGCLFAQIIDYFKTDAGGTYLEDPNDYRLQGWNYYVDVDFPEIRITVDAGGDTSHFSGTVDEMIKHYEINLDDVHTPQEILKIDKHFRRDSKFNKYTIFTESFSLNFSLKRSYIRFGIFPVQSKKV